MEWSCLSRIVGIARVTGHERVAVMESHENMRQQCDGVTETRRDGVMASRKRPRPRLLSCSRGDRHENMPAIRDASRKGLALSAIGSRCGRLLRQASSAMSRSHRLGDGVGGHLAAERRSGARRPAAARRAARCQHRQLVAWGEPCGNHRQDVSPSPSWESRPSVTVRLGG